MCGEVANRIVDFRTRIDNALRMVGEARKVHAILLALELLGMLAFLAVVNLECVVVACYNSELPRVIKVERGNRCRPRARSFESLNVVSIKRRSTESSNGLTLEGRKLAMTSLTFCIGGPAGGGGAPGVAEPAAMLRSMSATS